MHVVLSFVWIWYGKIRQKNYRMCKIIFAVSRCCRISWIVILRASSIHLFSLYANWYGSKSAGKRDLMNFKTTRSKHFIMQEVRATGLKSLNTSAFVFFGTGMIFENLKIDGTLQIWMDQLKITENTGASSALQFFKSRGLMLSGPAALCSFKQLNFNKMPDRIYFS